MPIFWKITASSFISAMLRSRCVFSMTFAASATLIELAAYTPAVMMAPYIVRTFSSVSGASPDTTLTIFVTVRSLSPGLIRSGE